LIFGAENLRVVASLNELRMPVAELQSPHFARNDTAYEIVGPPDAPVVVALGGISATRRVTDWWGDVAGVGRAIDTTRFRVLGFDYVDGGALPSGKPATRVSTYDQADALAAILDELGIARIHTLVGASYGGMVALAFAERHPTRVEQLVVVSAPARTHPMSTALRSIQRNIVELGLETGRAFDAMSLARQLAVTTYRSTTEFGERFDAASVQSYLRHQGEKFSRGFTPARFLALSRSADEHDVDPARITTPALLVSAEGDTIVPREQMFDLAARLAGRCTLRHTLTGTGHDAFLAEPNVVGDLIRNALLTSVLA
jgi:homoserine O-acetyltransferase